LDTTATLTDETLELHDRLIGTFFSKARCKYDRDFAADGQALNDKVRLYAKIGSALIASKAAHTDPFAAIEAVIPWEQFTASVAQAEKLSRDEAFDPLALLTAYFSTLRKYAPAFLEAFQFRGAPVAQSLLDAIDLLRAMNQTGARKVPADAPLGFVPPRWARSVGASGDIDRRFYELCALSELKNRLRAGDLYVVGSRQFQDFEDYLLPTTVFRSMRSADRLGVRCAHYRRWVSLGPPQAVTGGTRGYQSAGRCRRIAGCPHQRQGLEDLPARGRHASRGEALEIADLRFITARQNHRSLARGRSVDEFHPSSHTPQERRAGGGSVAIVDRHPGGRVQLGVGKDGRGLPGHQSRQAGVARGLAHSRRILFKGTRRTGQRPTQIAVRCALGRGSSSDGQRFRAGGHGESAGNRNAKYGSEPGVLFYTHLSDQYAPFYTKVINANVRDATHVLDGLLYHESQLRIEEHYTDTAGFTDQVFALCHMLGFEFAPRIADLADKRIYVPGKPGVWPNLVPLIGGPLNIKLMEQQFDEGMRLTASIKQGTVTASLILRKLAAYPRQNSLAMGLREYGRLERTLFTLKWLRDPALRRRVSGGLNKGEARNALARTVFFHRLGEIRDRSYENQRYRASGLNLVIAAITLWNTVYLERAVSALRERGAVNAALLRHIAPLGWNHIGLTGDYNWHANKRVAKGGFRPLRRVRPVESTIAAP
jgi:TnpA family transposase